MENAFHLSLPCLNLEETKNFYLNILGAGLGRFSKNWIDIDLFSHQITFTQCAKFEFEYPQYTFEGKVLPSFHFGIITGVDLWNALYDKLKIHSSEGIEEGTFLKNEPGEHHTFFVEDPNGYMIEFKCFKDQSEVFSSKAE